MLKAIVFDFDGVIVDSEKLHYRAFLRTVEHLGITFDYQHYLDHLIGFDDRDALAIMLPNADPSQINQLKQSKADAFESVVNDGIEPIAGVLQFIEQATKVMPTAIASGATRRDIDLILTKLKLIDRFDPIVTADDVAHSKPDPQTYTLAVQGIAQRHSHLNLSPSDCLAIEDTAAGIESARGAGLYTLGLTTSGPAKSLVRAHRIAPSFEGLTLQTLHDWFD